MATNQTYSSAGHQTHPLLEKFGQIAAAAGGGAFVYSVKIVCGKQTETNCGCCVAGTRPGLYATELAYPISLGSPVCMWSSSDEGDEAAIGAFRFC
jgi:hypothetical protein